MDRQKIHDNRQSARIRKIGPVAFALSDGGSRPARRTVCANVSRGGMLLVTRQDHFPPAGTMVDLMPQTDPESDVPSQTIPGKVVYTRFSPESDLHFAGLAFRTELNEASAFGVGLNSREDKVLDALNTLHDLEEMCREAPTARSKAARVDTAVPGDESKRIRAEMEGVCTDLFRAAERFVCAWAEQKILDTVVERHRLSRAKGMEGLRSLKEALASLIEDVPALVDAQLNRDSLWPHRQEEIDTSASAMGKLAYYDQERDRPPAWLVDEMRKLLGFAGVLLIKHGYDELSKGSQWEPLAQGRALVTYHGRFALSEEIIEALQRASRLYERLCENEMAMVKAREDKARRAVRDLWNQA